MCRLRCPGKVMFDGMCLNVWDQHVNWLPGEHCGGLEIEDSAKTTKVRLSCGALLVFEKVPLGQLRRQAFRGGHPVGPAQ